MFLYSFAFCCLGNVFLIAGTVSHMEILEERNILKEFMKYPLKNPKKDLDLPVLSLHLCPSTRIKSTSNGLDTVEESSQTILLGGMRKDAVTTQATPKTNRKFPQTSQSKRQQELEYEKLLEKYFKRKDWSRNRNKLRRPTKLRKPNLMLGKEDEEGYREVKHKNLRSRRTDLFSKSWRKKEPKGKRQSMYWKVKPTNGEFQKSELAGNWGDVGYLPLLPIIDGKVLNQEAPLAYNQLGGENYYNTQQVEKDEEEMWKQDIWDGVREHAALDQSSHRKFFSGSIGKVTSSELSLPEDHLKETESSIVTIVKEHFSYTPDEGTEQISVVVLPTRNGVKDSKLLLDNAQLWRMVVPVVDIPIIDVFSDTIQPVETHTGPYEAADLRTHLWSHGDILLQAEGSGRYNSMGLDHEDNMVTSPLNGPMAQEKRKLTLSQPMATIQHSSYSTFPTPTNSEYTTVPHTGSEELFDGVLGPLEATLTHNPRPIYCKPGYKEYGGICKSQCETGGIYCGNNGQCVIVENIGAMCKCQQMNSLCYGGECCQPSLTTFQLVCVIGGCCILLSMFLGSLPFLVRRVNIKAISKSVRTRLWISNLMPQPSTSSSSQSVDFTECSDYESPPDVSTFYWKKEMARNANIWQCERTRL